MSPTELNPAELAAALRLIDWSLQEDLAERGDVTTESLVERTDWGQIRLISRQPGVLAGAVLLPEIFARLDPLVAVRRLVPEGARIEPGTPVAELEGPLAALLTGERTALNFVLRMSGVATQTRRFVDAVAGTAAGIFDTRKTHPGWRLLDKYAVRMGGGRNHRIGLFDQILIKDNHLAGWLARGGGRTIAGAIDRCRSLNPGLPVEIEVDTLEQLAEALAAHPDMILLDNMSPADLRAGVRMRDELGPGVQLEASGGIRLEGVREIAETGLERISVGGLTHSAPALDLGFDWSGAGHRPVGFDSLT